MRAASAGPEHRRNGVEPSDRSLSIHDLPPVDELEAQLAGLTRDVEHEVEIHGYF